MPKGSKLLLLLRFLNFTLTLSYSFQTNHSRWLWLPPRSPFSLPWQGTAPEVLLENGLCCTAVCGTVYPCLSHRHHDQVITEHVISNVPTRWGKGSQVHSFTCLLQSPAEIHHLGCNKFWHTPLPKFTPFPHSLHRYPLSLSSFGLVACSLCSFLGSIPVVADLQWPQLASWGFAEEIPAPWIHWQDLSSSQCVVAG